MVNLEPVTYPVNDTSKSTSERAYLQKLQDEADTQNLSQDLRPEVRNLSIAFTILACGVVGLRFLARHRQRAPYGADDWLILAALALLGGNLAFNLVMVDQGLGLHSGTLTQGELEKLNQTVVGAEVIYTTAVNMYKIALLFLYFRIFPLPVIRKWCYICGGISTAWNIACIFAASFQCNPRNKIWEPWVDGYCINLFLAQLCISIPSILCDIAILCIPLPHILRLKTNLTQKIFLVIIFMLGSYVVFTSIYRFVVYLSYSSQDAPYTLAVPCAWNVIEISSGIVSSCLPTLGPIIRPLIKSIMPSSLGASGHLSYGPKHRRGPSTPGLVTIGGGGGGGGASHSKSTMSRSGGGKWSRFDDDTMASAGDELYVGAPHHHDIEMGPRTTVTATREADRPGSASSGSEGGSGGRKTSSKLNQHHATVVGGGVLSPQGTRGSDELPIMGISKTTQMEWTVENIKPK